jgi:hypothetical protein
MNDRLLQSLSANIHIHVYHRAAALLQSWSNKGIEWKGKALYTWIENKTFELSSYQSYQKGVGMWEKTYITGTWISF